MRLYGLSHGGKVMCPCGRGARYVGGRNTLQKGTGALGSLLLTPQLGSSMAGAGLIAEVPKKPSVVPIKDTTALQQKLNGLSKLKLRGKYANL
jgi:hypothetical protein